ncbi:hypothetical protein C8R43DRAFT_1237042 [Mycena crocata]|nr:hypothetical protein C8R43DRAFT_1237042 [Mycena crocata]
MASPIEFNLPLPTKRSVPLQVLALGFSRTGTASLKIALEALGYVRTNHGFVVFTSPAHIDMWIAAIEAKFLGKGKPFGRHEWDVLLGDCQELIALYPDAKVLLTTRDANSWWSSYEATVAEWNRPSLDRRLASWLDPVGWGKRGYLEQLCSEHLFKTKHVTADIAKERFREHYDEVRRLSKNSNAHLLEFDVAEGWRPLCAFLGKEVPGTAFPRVNNDRSELRKFIAGRRRAVFWMFARAVLGPLLVTVSAVTAAYLLV